jgi:hypothetical protein
MTITYLHSLPRQLGSKTFIVWFLLACAEQEQITPVSHRWLLDHMPAQTSPNTITTALQYLCNPENQIAVRVTGGWRLASAVQLPLQIKNRAESDSWASSSSSAMEESKDTFEDPLLPPARNRAERDSWQVSAKSREDRQACKAACLNAGIHDPTATQIAALIWVTPNYIRDHVAEVQRHGQEIGLAIWRMKNQWNAPADKSDGRRYAEGEYSDYIEH